jgi:hypothetical protein
MAEVCTVLSHAGAPPGLQAAPITPQQQQQQQRAAAMPTGHVRELTAAAVGSTAVTAEVMTAESDWLNDDECPPPPWLRRKTDFECWESNRDTKNRKVNTAAGLELHTGVLTPAEQRRLVAAVKRWEQAGRDGQLGGRTFSAPKKWMKGKGRVTMQVSECAAT